MNGFKLTSYKQFWQIISLLVVDGIFFTNSNAGQVAPFILIVGFLLLVFTSYLLLFGAISIMRLYGLPIRHKKRLSVYLTLILGSIIALQSIGELSSRDIIVLLPLVTLGYMYGLYITTHRRNLDA
jgi:hypothetical protein